MDCRRISGDAEEISLTQVLFPKCGDSLALVVGRAAVPQRGARSNCEVWEYVTFHGERSFPAVSVLRILKWKDYPRFWSI